MGDFYGTPEFLFGENGNLPEGQSEHKLAEMRNVLLTLSDQPTITNVEQLPDNVLCTDLEGDKVFTDMLNAQQDDFVSQSMQIAGIGSELQQNSDGEYALLTQPSDPFLAVSPHSAPRGDSLDQWPSSFSNVSSPSFSNVDSPLFSPSANSVAPIPTEVMNIDSGFNLDREAFDTLSSESKDAMVMSSLPVDLPPLSNESTPEAYKPSTTRKAPKSRRRAAHKPKLYEREEPFEDPIAEQNRQNAIKAYKNRVKKSQDHQKLTEENTRLKEALAEKEKIISDLKMHISSISANKATNVNKLHQIKQLINELNLE